MTIMIVRESSVLLVGEVSIPALESITDIKMICHKLKYIFVSLLYSAITVFKEYKLRSQGEVSSLVTTGIKFSNLRISNGFL